MNKNLVKRCEKIKVVLTDVDGVLTDGGMYYSRKGDSMKKFFARDGMGVTLLRRKKIPTIIVTKEKNEVINRWARSMKIKKVYDGVIKKESILEQVTNNFKVRTKEIAYIGDDVNDIELIKKVGFSAVPSDGIEDCKKNCVYVCKNHGGKGAFREVADLIILSKYPKEKIVY